MLMDFLKKNQPPLLTPAWLAGFWQAEGGIYTFNHSDNCALRFSQKDRFIIRDILRYFGCGSSYKDNNNVWYARFNGWEEVGTVVDVILPYLVGHKREDILNVCDATGVPIVCSLDHESN